MQAGGWVWTKDPSQGVVPGLRGPSPASGVSGAPSGGVFGQCDFRIVFSWLSPPGLSRGHASETGWGPGDHLYTTSLESQGLRATEGPRGFCQGCFEPSAAPQMRFCETEERTLLVNIVCGVRATCWAIPAALNVGACVCVWGWGAWSKRGRRC